MLRKLSFLAIIPVALIFAMDVSVDDAYTVPYPAVVRTPNAVVATLNVTDGREMDIPIHATITTSDAPDTILCEGFEEEAFPPAGWDLIPQSVNSTWFRGQDDELRHNGSWGAYVYSGEEASNEWLIAKSIDITSVGEGQSVNLVFNSSFTACPSEDPFFHNYVCVSSDGGETWADTLIDLTVIESPTGGPVFIEDSPNPFNFDLSSYAGQTIEIGFNYRSDPEGFSAPQTVDDVMVIVGNLTTDWSADEMAHVMASGTTNYEFESKWTPEDVSIYTVTVWIDFEDDDLDNNWYIGSLVAGGETDLELVSIIRPNSFETPGEYFLPECVVGNLADNDATGLVKCYISQDGKVCYVDSTSVLIKARSEDVDVTFTKPFLVGDAGTSYNAVFVVSNPSDMDSTNNSKSKGFKSAYEHSIIPVEAIAPIEGGDYTAPFNPKALFENQGASAENDWWAKAVIEESGTGITIWTDSVHRTVDLWPGEQEAIVFSTFTPSYTEKESYICTFSAISSTEGFGSEDLGVGFSGGTNSGTEENPLPREYALSLLTIGGNNPTIMYALPNAAFLSLRVYDVSGKLVKTIAASPSNPGYGRITLDTRSMSAGLYFIRMEASDFTSTKKLVLVK